MDNTSKLWSDVLVAMIPSQGYERALRTADSVCEEFMKRFGQPTFEVLTKAELKATTTNAAPLTPVK